MAKTIAEIAYANNLSVTTVKLVLNGNAKKYRISEKTQQKIKSYVEKHGCIINQAARNLKLKKTDTFGFIVPNLRNSFYAELTEVMANFCLKHNYQLLSAFTESNEKTEKKTVESLLSRGVDGLFVVSTSSASQKETLKQVANKPIIFMDRYFEDNCQSSVLSENYIGSKKLTEQVLKKSPGKVSYIYGNGQLPVIKDRVRGFCDANLEKKNNYELVEAKLNTKEEGVLAMYRIYEKSGKVPNALVFSSLPLLEGALHFIKSTIGSIPKELIIGTFDDHTMLDFLPNHVISVQQDIKEIAKVSIDLMLKILNKKEIKKQNFLIPTIIIERKREGYF